MKGTVAGNVGNAHLWVVCKEEDHSIYFPQDEEIHPIHGNWSLPGVRVGAGDMGKDVPYELKVIQANDIMDEAFRLYVKIGRYKNEWIGFSHTSGIRELAKVTVVRR